MDSKLPQGTAALSEVVQVHFDGAFQRRPGGHLATYGFTVEGGHYRYEEFGPAVKPGSDRATNNIAEYVAAIRSLEWLRARGYRGAVLLMGDSELVIRQMKGEYRVLAKHLEPYAEHLRQLAAVFDSVQFMWVPREANKRADWLSKKAL